MTDIRSLYLAHPLVMRKEVREWELGFEERTGINLVNPFYDQMELNPEAEQIIQMDNNTLKPNTMTSRGAAIKIISSDLDKIVNSEGLVAFVEPGKESIGTQMEIFYNAYLLKRPTYIITRYMEGHPWILGLATETFKHPVDFERYIIQGGSNGRT